MRLSGPYHLFFADLEEVRFDRPEEAVGKTLRAGPMLVTHKEFGRTRDPLAPKGVDIHEFKLQLGVDPSASREWKERLKTVPLARRTLREATCQMTPRFAGDAPETESVFLMPLKGEDPLAPEIHGSFSGRAGPPASISIRVGKSVRPGSFPFSFKDLELP